MSTIVAPEPVSSVERDDPKKNLYEKIEEKIESLSVIKFAAYRVACKLRVLQKYLKLNFVDSAILVRIFSSFGLPFDSEIERISTEQARNVLTGIYQSISVYHFNESSLEETVESFLRFLKKILDEKTENGFEIHGFRIVIFTLSNAKLVEKYRFFFREIADSESKASQFELEKFFEKMLRVPNYFDQVDSFHYDNIGACIASCLENSGDGSVSEDTFVNWMTREPQTFVWLPTLQRLIATESVRHEAQCNTCKAYPLIGMRYRCLRCFNYDLCQRCFFTGDHGSKHDGTHPIEEYCKQVTPLEDLKAFVEFMKLKVGKKQVPRKERYLTIRRSKSFSETTKTRAESSSNKNSQNSLSRSDQKSKNENAKSKRKTPERTTDENSTPIEIHRDDLVTRSIPISYEEENCEAPLLAVKQRKIVVKSKKETVESEHYQSPLVEKQFEDEETPPPLPPKQRKIRQTSRSLVYDFIGTELKELHATLAKFEPN